MSINRKNMILEIIKDHEVETQQQLVDLLAEKGFIVTQATISRDIRDLKLIKAGSESGKNHYIQPPKAETKLNDKFVKILKETIKGVRSAENLIVVSTLSGCASAAAEAVDSASTEEIIGTIAGDNTILIIVDTKEHVPSIVRKIEEIIA